MATLSKHPPRVAVLIVEDEWITAHDLEQTITSLGYHVTALAPSAAAALAAIEKELPDLALVDIRLEGAVDGIELARTIRSRWSFPVIYLTAHSDQETVNRLKETEPAAYVAKPFEQGQLRVAVELALHNAAAARQREGQAAARTASLEARTASLESSLRRIASALTDVPSAALPIGSQVPEQVRAALDALSHREVEVLQLLLANRRVPTIARELSLSTYTVRNHLRSIFRKAGVHSQDELLRLMEPCRPQARLPRG